MHYPKHIAIIPDGNRTRAKERGLPSVMWHIEWKKRTKELLDYIIEQTPIEVVTLWWLSTENALQRSADERAALYDIFKQAVEEIIPSLVKHKINFRRAWSPEWLPPELVELFRATQKTYVYDSPKWVVIAVNYGWRDEIIRGIQAWQASEEASQPLTAELLSPYLDFGGLPPVEMVVRTKGDDASRTSGFMSWWIGYAELYFTSIKFPDFTLSELDKALARFDDCAEKRNFGK